MADDRLGKPTIGLKSRLSDWKADYRLKKPTSGVLMKILDVRALRTLLIWGSDPLKSENTIERGYMVSSGYTIEK